MDADQEIASSAEPALAGARRSAAGAPVVDFVVVPGDAVGGSLAQQVEASRAEVGAAIPKTTRRTWMRRYRAAVIGSDAVSAVIAATAAFALRFGDLDGAGRANPYVWSIAVLPAVWVTIQALGRAYDPRILGLGAEEFQRTWRAVLYLTAVLACGFYLFQAHVARGFVLVAVPLTVVLTSLGRYLGRRCLHRLRNRRGVAVSRVIILGDAAHAGELASEMLRDAYAGLRPVAACLTTVSSAGANRVDELRKMGLTVLDDPDDLLAVVTDLDADAVAVTASHGLGAQKLRWISWQLEGTGVDLLVAPGLIEVTGRRLHVRPVSVVPLLQVESPRYSGFSRLMKGCFDRVAAALLLLVLAPLLLVLAVLIRATSSGPALFRQTRVGRDCKPFVMVKFRSMHSDAEHRLVDLIPASMHGDEILFKMRNDPRVTRLGRFLRKYSIDELPQLFNVLTGSMSLVGPRPPLPREVDCYGNDVRRRLLVKPGVTGLWQVSGRSDLSWEESVRLDLRYVENWSLAGDVQILWKTVAAVFRASGAY